MKIRNPSNAAPNVRAAPARAAAWQHGQAGKRAKIRLNGIGKMRVGIPYGFTLSNCLYWSRNSYTE